MDLFVELMENVNWTLINTVVDTSGSYNTAYWLAYERIHTYIKNTFPTAYIL